ncbi:radical SAM protein [Oceanispirochaeta crateris]|uniref:Radical SAM protein n=1 Tax=Oceanispirochaeta crateris TaxID=2518645 RepID=A0A5C1QSI3_9SPIO|nr:radical SAM protein [Oceanispirochaeta crateris]QEN09556.1 radical SAM protein [Oceanispirochaeta crateris]
MVLINPPSLRNCEPPVALLKLSAALRSAGEEVQILDGAAEAYYWLTTLPAADPEDSRAQRTRKNKERLWQSLCQEKSTGDTSPNAYASFDRYKKNLNDLSYLAQSSLPPVKGIRITPADLEIEDRSPLQKADLIHAWTHPEESFFYPWFSKRLTDFLQPNASGTVGISIGYLSQALIGMSICGYIKQQWPEVRIQLGGGLIISWLKGPADCSFLKDLVHEVQGGPGEEAIVAFAGKDWQGPGLADPEDLYKLPYIAPGPILPYSASFGCSWKKCTFCNEHWEDNPFCEEGASAVVSNLRTLVKKHDPALIHITDSEISLGLIKELAKNPPGAPWYSFSRFFPVLTDPGFCHQLAQSGCTMLCLGLESGDQNVLDALKKGIHLNQVRAILQNLRGAGIGTFVYVMFGTAVENRDAALRTRDFILEQRQNISFINAAVFSMPVMSRELEQLESRNFYEGELSLYKDFTHPLGFGRRQVREFLSKDFQAIPEIREILKRTPPIFTSNHAPFFIPLK